MERQEIVNKAEEYANSRCPYDREDSRQGDMEAMRESIKNHAMRRAFTDGYQQCEKDMEDVVEKASNYDLIVEDVKKVCKEYTSEQLAEGIGIEELGWAIRKVMEL